MMKRIGLGAGLGLAGSDGGYALNLALQIARRGMRPILLNPAERPLELDSLHRRLLAPTLDEYRGNREAIERNRGCRLPFPVLHALGDRLSFPVSVKDTPGKPDIGIACFAHVDIPADKLERAADWPLIVTASSWNSRVLRDRGLTNVLHCPPGVDLSLFHPAPRAGLLSEHFVVFSGGPLSYAQGQDIVIAAFRAFRERHPEALLVSCWGTSCPDGMGDLATSPHVVGLPDVSDGTLQLTAWLARNGVPPAAVLDLGLTPDNQLPGILRECDLAVFPGRCASGLERVVMAVLACGLPAVLPGHTGYLDLLGDHAYVLKDLGDVARLSGDPGKAGWGECTVDELLAAMEQVYARRREAAEKGRAAARFMADWSWERQSGRLLAAVDRAIAGKPVPPPLPGDIYKWGLSLHRSGRFAEAERAYDEVIEGAPDHVGARMDRGHVRREQGDAAAAEADFRSILAARPDHPQALQALGNLLRQDGRVEAAADCLRRSLAAADTPSLHWDFAYALLQLGRYREAWPHFNHRHAALGLRAPGSAKPRWDGRPVENGTLLVLDEQGLGDTLQFLRFLPHIPLGPGGRVVFAGKPATLSVARRLLPATDVFRWDRPLPHSQAWVPLMSLAESLSVAAPEDVPPPAPAALVDPEWVARWRPLVRGADDRPVVGLCWRGNPDFPQDAVRSPGLAALRPLFDIKGLRFISLQVGPGRREIDELGLADQLVDVGGAVEAAGADVLDTLAVLASCDFVITSCTSVAHMAGLAGRPGRVLLSSRPDWRWLTERADTPWYPSLRLIRQRTAGDWAAVAAEVAAQLVAWREQMPPGCHGVCMAL